MGASVSPCCVALSEEYNKLRQRAEQKAGAYTRSLLSST